MPDVRGYIRVILPRYPEAGQRKALEAAGVSGIVVEDRRKELTHTRADLIKIVRKRTVIAIQHLFLLADPEEKRKRGGTRADLWKAIDAIEAKGGHFWELSTGLNSGRPRERDEMTRAAVEALALGRHKTGADKRGRPLRSFDEKAMADARLIWADVKRYPTWEAARKALPKRFTLARAYKLWGARIFANTQSN